jgi:hypothetical protein
MDSRRAYRVMEDFVNGLPNRGDKHGLVYALSSPKPFKKFREAIHRSPFREDWFAIQSEANIEWVKEQLAEHERKATTGRSIYRAQTPQAPECTGKNSVPL